MTTAIHLVVTDLMQSTPTPSSYPRGGLGTNEWASGPVAASLCYPEGKRSDEICRSRFSVRFRPQSSPGDRGYNYTDAKRPRRPGVVEDGAVSLSA